MVITLWRRGGRALDLLWIRLRKVVVALSSHRGRRALLQGVVPAYTARDVLRRLQPVLVLDVGANRGQFTLDVLDLCPSSTIIAFEPLASEADIFERVVDRDPRVEIRRCALGSEAGAQAIYRTEAADSSSILMPSATQIALNPGSAVESTESVEVTTLAVSLATQDLPDRTLLKLDVQGSELAVLIGAGTMLEKIRWVWVEVSFAELYMDQALAGDVVSFLHGAGFDWVDVGEVVRDGDQAVQTDLLFERRP